MNIEGNIQSYTEAEIAANNRVGWFGYNSDVAGWQFNLAGPTRKNCLTLDVDLDSNYAMGNLQHLTAHWAGLGAAKGRIVYTDAATDTIAMMSANVGVGVAPERAFHFQVSDAPGAPAGGTDFLLEKNGALALEFLSGSNSYTYLRFFDGTSVGGFGYYHNGDYFEATFNGGTTHKWSVANTRIGSPSDAANDYFNIGVGTDGATIISTVDGAGADANLTLSPDGNVFIASGSIKSGATQVAASAAANEIWKTASHATLPDNVLMIGV